MRLPECQGSRPRSRGLLALSLAVGLCLVSYGSVAAAATLGAFELKHYEMRSPETEERLEFALAEIKYPVAFAAEEGDKPTPAAEGGDKPPAAEQSAEKADEGASGQTGGGPATAQVGNGSEKDGAAPAATPRSKSAAAPRIVVPRPGEQGSGSFYDSRASEVLKAEVLRTSDPYSPRIEAGANVVVCVGGCSDDRIGVVYFEVPQPSPVASGEMTQSSTSAGESAAENTIACIAGCYDEAPKMHAARTPERTLKLMQDAIDRAAANPRRSSLPAADDWQTVKPAKADGVAPSPTRKTAAARRVRLTEKPGAWFTRIIKSRSSPVE